MNLWWGALRAETRKARVSAAAWATGLAGLLFPLICGLFMVIVKDPEGAKKLGLIGAKARLSGLTADWPSYLGLLDQAVAVGFLFLSALFATWLFGRESSDRTLKLLLAVPAGRIKIVTAKFVVLAVWGVATLALMAAAGLLIGLGIGLPGAMASNLSAWVGTFFLVGLLTLVLAPWVTFFASAGRGFLIPLAWTLATVAAANLGAVLGFGSVVPWAIPSLFAGTANAASPGIQSLVEVGITGLLGVAATAAFWKWADHPK